MGPARAMPFKEDIYTYVYTEFFALVQNAFFGRREADSCTIGTQLWLKKWVVKTARASEGRELVARERLDVVPAIPFSTLF